MNTTQLNVSSVPRVPSQLRYLAFKLFIPVSQVSRLLDINYVVSLEDHWTGTIGTNLGGDGNPITSLCALKTL